jgi:hypothetical protein
MEDVLNQPRPNSKALQARAAEFSLDRALEQYLALWRREPVV